MTATYLGHWLTQAGRQHNFRIEARDHDHAEDLARDLSPRAVIDGEVIHNFRSELGAMVVRAVQGTPPPEVMAQILSALSDYLGRIIALTAQGDPASIERLATSAEAKVMAEATRVAPIARACQ